MTNPSNPLQELRRLGQSAWFDNIRRGHIKSGEMQQLIDRGVTGLTSNPTIFEKAISGSTDYDDSLLELARDGRSAVEIFEALAMEDIRDVAAYFARQGGPEQGSARTGSRVESGRQKAGACSACHGEAGISPTGNWPSLAGQHEDYMREVMMQYKNQTRTDPVMQGQAQILTDEDIADLAAFYAAQRGLFTVQYTR